MRKWSAGRALALALAMGLAVPGLAWAQSPNTIRSIDSAQQAGAEMVRIELDEPLAAVPAGFAIQVPPRIAIDLPGITSALGKSVVEVNSGNLRSVNVAQAGERTRLVLNLKQPASYRAQIDGKALVVILEPTASSVMADGGAAQPAVAAAAAAAPATSATAAPAPVAAGTAAPAPALAAATTPPIRDIDFRRGQDGSGRVIVNLPSSQVGVDIRQQGKFLVVEFLRTSVPDNLRRQLDVTDFGTPVQSIATSQTGDRVRMVVEPKGAWEHSAYQSDDQFVLEVRPQKIDPNKLTQGPGYSGEKLSLNFQNIEVRALLQVIADFTNFNVVTSDTVTGNVTLRLKDVPWDQALDIIMQAKGLGQRKSGNVIWIAPKDELAAKEKVDLESKAQIAALEPLRTQSFQLNYTKAEDVAKGLTGQNGSQASGGGGGGTTSRILSPRGNVIFESRTNQLFVSDIPSKLEEVTQMIAMIDIPVRQVLIEARIVEASDTFGRSLGVKLGGSDLSTATGTLNNNAGYGMGGSNRVVLGGSLNGVAGASGQNGGSTALANTNFVNFPAASLGNTSASAASFALSLFSASAQRFLNLEISALEAEGKGKLVSSPRVITADQVKAIIEQGEELPYQVASSSGATSIQFKKANLKLEVTPQITPEGNVILDVDVNKDSKGELISGSGYTINTKHVKTQVLIENGGTVVIGGIFTLEEIEKVNKVPLLGDIPVVGNLFKSKARESNKTELLVFLTPKVVTDKTAAR